jgi:hypothetical protein
MMHGQKKHQIVAIEILTVPEIGTSAMWRSAVA